jgi:hypothetical protein
LALLRAEHPGNLIDDLAYKKKVTASDSFSANPSVITDGSDNFWKTMKNEAWVIIDLGDRNCFLKYIIIHWFGSSFADKICVDVKSNEDGAVWCRQFGENNSQNVNNFNRVTVFPNVDVMVRYIKFTFEEGHLDTWYHRYFFAIRHIFVRGEVANVGSKAKARMSLGTRMNSSNQLNSTAAPKPGVGEGAGAEKKVEHGGVVGVEGERVAFIRPNGFPTVSF